MKKIILMSIMLVHHVAYAQLLGSIKLPEDFVKPTVKSDSITWVQKVVAPGIFVVSQQYQLKNINTGDLFGLNGKEEFGTSYCLGIKAKNGYLLTDNTLRPWIYDDNFKNFKDQYEPVRSINRYWGVSDSVSHVASTDSLVAVEPDSLIYQYSSNRFNGEGFNLATPKADVKGWIVWVAVSSSDNPANPVSLNYIVSEKTIKFSDNSRVQIPSPSTDKRVLGGVYIQVNQKGIGVLEFTLSSIMVRNGEQWFAVRVPQNMTQKMGNGSDVLSLTPVAKTVEKQQVKEEKQQAKKIGDKEQKKGKKEKPSKDKSKQEKKKKEEGKVKDKKNRI